MAVFSTTALDPNSPLFRGRQDDLAWLLHRCQGDVTAYLALYGGRQNGKTSLLLRLEAKLKQQQLAVCRLDLQIIKGASPERSFAFVSEHVAEVLPLGPEPHGITDGPGLRRFLSQALARTEVTRLVLILDEWGALPAATREVVANAMRSIFDARHTMPALRKLLVIFSGGIELYDLIVSEASSLHSVCEELYLSDLPEDAAVSLIADGLQKAGVEAEQATRVGHAVYTRVVGHPYLTQRIGGLLIQFHQRGQTFDAAAVANAERQVREGNPLLRRIWSDLRGSELADAARLLLSDPPRFTRLDDNMARLELIGLAKPAGAHWAPRNPLLAEVFRDLLGLTTDGTSRPARPDPDVIAAKRRYLKELELKAAQFGIHTPAHISIEIEDLRRELATLEPATATLPPTVLPAAPPQVAPPPPAPPPTVALPSTAVPAQPTKPSSLILHPSSLVHIPAGPFLMGSSDTDKLADSNEKPQHTLSLPDYWIGKTPITNAQFRPFVEGDGYTNRAYWTTAGWAWREQDKIVRPHYWTDAKWNGNEQPVVGVSWFEAVAYVRWLSAQTGHPFRLPTEAEWEKAARGPDGLIWPWGNTWKSGRCNSEEAGTKKTTPVGQYPSGASPYGVLDMAGNVWEWCATKLGKGYPYQLEDEWTEAYLAEDTPRRFRGGSWYHAQKYVRGASRYILYGPRDRYDDQGVRVASNRPLRGSDK
ncbi:MAG: SUMF1/EgtB/PvdO family nonheme iron enzyme [Oscillochloridaceae bacterium umkhey_bin13]